MQGWLLRVIGKGQKQREVPLPADVVGELARYLAARGLAADPADIGNQGAFLLGKASDSLLRALEQRVLAWRDVFASREGVA
jgi:site-specific recombinase XerC